MAQTTTDVRRDIELTRERMSDTIAQLEQKLNVMEMVREHPWPSLAAAAAVGVLLAGSKADVKAAVATVKATGGASDKLGALLDDTTSRLIEGVSAALSARVDEWVDDLKNVIGSPATLRRERDVGPTPALPPARDRGAGDGSVGRSGANGPARGEGRRAGPEGQTPSEGRFPH